MSVVFIMAPIALVLAAVAVVGFVWAARDGQFDDVETPKHRILFDDPPPKADVTDKR
ncbi:cbb3-type cytochrome oxidase assembly protein CcoS [Botrimarina hoheduenensis]|uniref:Cytochrome oxidase maturation protein cbb3-type n=1 Tax=Botrimarina hoheduenensis TaxID=2528000 RepID=A0A5C5VRS1_9BACT|nr:cbb3-type cytochrome oxidase assembly protein CcoS [Botrimarina hoheduenensis]TWT40773.1 Cytochrome oxidase maturation protein cbb3-type [Botrimarina hoheduenensis]